MLTPTREVGPQPRRSPWRRASSFALLLASLALAVGIARANGLWADEFFSLAIATGHSLEHPAAGADPSRGDFVESPRPLAPSSYARYLTHESPAAGPAAVIRATLLSDTSPPLYYLSLWAWSRGFGTSDMALRLHSVAWWAGCFGPLSMIARVVGGRRAVWPARVIFCLTPTSLFFATEGRMYSMLWFVTLATVLATLLLGRGPGRRPAWLLAIWVAASATGFLTHYFFVFPWTACVGWLLVYPGRVGRVGVLGSAALVVAAVMPWYAHLPESLAAWRVTGDWLKVRPWGYSVARCYAATARSYFSMFSVVGGKRQAAWIAFVVILMVGLISGNARRRYLAAPPLLLLGWLLASLAGPAVFDLLRGTYAVAVPRYAIAGAPAAYLLVALGLARLGRVPRMALLVAFLVPWLIGIRALFNDDRAFEPARQIGQILADDARDSDVVIVHSIPSGVAGIGRYLADGGGDARGITLAPWVGQLGQRRVPEDLDAILAGRARARLVIIHRVGAPSPEEDWLRRNATLVGEKHLGNATLLDFAPKRSSRFSAIQPVIPPPEGQATGPDRAG